MWVNYKFFVNFQLCVNYKLWVNYQFWVNYQLCVNYKLWVNYKLLLSEVALIVTMYLCPWLSIKYCWNSLSLNIFHLSFTPIFFSKSRKVTHHWSLFTRVHDTHIPIYLRESIFQQGIMLKWFTWISCVSQKQVTVDYTEYSTVRHNFISFADFIFCFVPISS